MLYHLFPRISIYHLIDQFQFYVHKPKKKKYINIYIKNHHIHCLLFLKKRQLLIIQISILPYMDEAVRLRLYKKQFDHLPIQS